MILTWLLKLVNHSPLRQLKRNKSFMALCISDRNVGGGSYNSTVLSLSLSYIFLLLCYSHVCELVSNEHLFTLQVWHCMEGRQVRSDLGISSWWIWIDTKICQSRFQIKVCRGVNFIQTNVKLNLRLLLLLLLLIIGFLGQHNIRFLQEILQNRKSDFLEWLIIILIGAEILISVYDIAHKSAITSL